MTQQSWSEILKTTKEELFEYSTTKTSPSGGSDVGIGIDIVADFNIDHILDIYRPLFARWRDQLKLYERTIGFSVPNENKIEHDSTSTAASTDVDAATKKEVILETRGALRFGLLCCSFPNDTLRKAFQTCVITEYQWHVRLLESVLLVQSKRGTGGGDPKSRLFAAQLLSNIVTDNFYTARVLSKELPLSPTEERVNSTILENLSTNLQQDENGDHASTTNVTTVAGSKIEPTWVDIILACAKANNRQALSAVIAALHNCIAALESIENKSNSGDDNHGSIAENDDASLAFANKVASDTMLVSTLMRQFVGISAFQASISSAKKENKSGNANDNNESDPWDSATEWIYLLVTKLAALGLFTTMYRSIAPTSTKDEINNMVLPEQNILLHCLLKEIESYSTENTKRQNQNGVNNVTAMPLGGSLAINGSKAACVSITNLLLQLWPIHNDSKVSGKSNDDGDDDTDMAVLRHSAVASLLDVLAILFGIDNSTISALREHLGMQTSLLQNLARHLGRIVDDLNERSLGKKARELKLSLEEQNRLTSVVRLIGNLCFSCRHNQDLLRTTLVPPVTMKNDSSAPSTTTSKERNALHVLLSCTSFATSCFTLREWSVIAIRNALENNDQNQTLVAQLDAQNPVQSAELKNAGIRVEMDGKGKVSLATLDENDEVEGG